ncbi:glycoside hydrolase superfamily [Absidia repens]|uniref:glucan endo-1,3-beta-D-glucosidase n=1 Tax=Absidia repens TaxID=90262 RepID=A0A1X2IST6_9FUNG|nr:glycoside hydrolase superfamily [Absidia repens]
MILVCLFESFFVYFFITNKHLFAMTMVEEDPKKTTKNVNIADEQELKKRESKRFSCGLKVTAILVLIIIGVLAGVVPFLVNNHYLDFLFGGDEISSSQDTGIQNGTKNNNTSTSSKNYTHYEKDSRLSRSFWGIDYTPTGAQLEYGCSVTQDDVIEDLKLLHQLTPRLRLYGLDCDQGYYVMNGMKLMKIDMGLILTVWVDGNSTTYERQYNAFWKLLDEFGADHITGVSIGNEALYRKEITPDELIERIREFKSKMKKRGYSHIPVYTTDIRSLPELMPEEDQVLDNVHPFFAGVTVDQAPAWTWKYFKDVVIIPTINLAKSKGMTNVKPALISEVGWPSALNHDLTKPPFRLYIISKNYSFHLYANQTKEVFLIIGLNSKMRLGKMQPLANLEKLFGVCLIRIGD